ncbi:MAG TPA: NfeD family protein [Anaerolineales bacterium]|nr:NfeD family protein [Anaerolineales bacterium]
MIEAILLNPNVAYLLLVGGALLAILALLNPGTGLLEVAALILLVLAGWGIYSLPINYWALGLLLLGVLPFLFALRRSGRMVYLGVSIAALVVGSIFLFQGEGLKPAVNPFLALLVSLLVVGFVWLVAQKTLEADRVRPVHDLKALIDTIGEAKTDIHAEGSAQVAGELWSARSQQPIPVGSKVRVIAREGFILDVEKAE